MYALLLDPNGRILAIMDEKYKTEDAISIEDYPQEIKDGGSYNYRYVDGEWIFDPIKGEPTEADDIVSLLIDHEYRLTLLELGIIE